MSRPIRLVLSCVLGLGLLGCGAGGGVASGALVTVYISAPLHGEAAGVGTALCSGARRELARSHARAGRLRVRAVCLNDSGASGHWSLAAVGANARRASEDSTTVGYIGEPEAAARRFSHPILAAAGIAQVGGKTGAAAMASLLAALRAEAGSDEVRESVRARLASG